VCVCVCAYVRFLCECVCVYLSVCGPLSSYTLMHVCVRERERVHVCECVCVCVCVYASAFFV